MPLKRPDQMGQGRIHSNSDSCDRTKLSVLQHRTLYIEPHIWEQNFQWVKEHRDAKFQRDKQQLSAFMVHTFSPIFNLLEIREGGLLDILTFTCTHKKTLRKSLCSLQESWGKKATMLLKVNKTFAFVQNSPWLWRSEWKKWGFQFLHCLNVAKTRPKSS